MAGAKRRGFASMNEEKQREIASMGGKAAHKKGSAHEFSSEEARSAGRKGGEAVSQNRDHMAQIGRKGGEAVSRDREHMAQIGRKGGESNGETHEGRDWSSRRGEGRAHSATRNRQAGSDQSE
jgi:uncharacterized protein